VIKQALGIPVTFGGEEPVGWLPNGAARPQPSSKVPVFLDVSIEGDDRVGYLLCWDGPATELSGDLWYERLEDAEAAAYEHFGVGAGDWRAAGQGDPEEPA